MCCFTAWPVGLKQARDVMVHYGIKGHLGRPALMKFQVSGVDIHNCQYKPYLEWRS